jgi:hypothetical protein
MRRPGIERCLVTENPGRDPGDGGRVEPDRRERLGRKGPVNEMFRGSGLGWIMYNL